jgi:transposase InsO family protein
LKRGFNLQWTARVEPLITFFGAARAVERLWRTVKYEHIYLWSYSNGWELEAGLKKYFNFYNYERPHQSLNYKTPSELYLITESNKKMANFTFNNI